MRRRPGRGGALAPGALTTVETPNTWTLAASEAPASVGPADGVGAVAGASPVTAVCAAQTPPLREPLVTPLWTAIAITRLLYDLSLHLRG